MVILTNILTNTSILTRIDLVLKSNSLQKACFEHSPLGNLLSKKLKVSGDDENENDENDDDENENENDVDLLNEIKNHLNNLPRPVLQLPRQQSDLQTQTMPILSTRPVQQSGLQTQLPTQFQHNQYEHHLYDHYHQYKQIDDQ